MVYKVEKYYYCCFAFIIFKNFFQNLLPKKLFMKFDFLIPKTKCNRYQGIKRLLHNKFGFKLEYSVKSFPNLVKNFYNETPKKSLAIPFN